MRYLELQSVSETNQILRRLEDNYPQLTVILDTYSCKYTKKQKKKNDYKMSLTSYLTNSLELSFPDYSFPNIKIQNFKSKTYKEIKRNVFGCLSSIINNYEEVKELIDLIGIVVDKNLGILDSIIYSFDKKEGPFYESAWFYCYLFYSKKRKRVLVFSGILNKMKSGS